MQILGGSVCQCVDLEYADPDESDSACMISFYSAAAFYARQHVVSAYHVLAIVILSVRPSVCLSRPGTNSSPGEIETPGFHHMIA